MLPRSLPRSLSRSLPGTLQPSQPQARRQAARNEGPGVSRARAFRHNSQSELSVVGFNLLVDLDHMDLGFLDLGHHATRGRTYVDVFDRVVLLDEEG